MRILLKILALFSITIMVSIPARCQQLGFDFPPGVHHMRIDFEEHNNLMVIPVTINGTIQLKFILDTGVQYPILTEKFFADMLGFEYEKRILIQGPGVNDSISAFVVRDIDLELQGGITSGINQFFLVLEKDFLNLRENLGADVYGIIGYDIFSRFTVEINHEENYIVLHDPKKFHHRKRYKKLPLQIVNTKPYLEVSVNKGEVDEKKLRLMVDTGASHSILLSNPDHNSLLPDTNIPSVIGRGLGGDIFGHLGRLAKIGVGKFEMEQPIASFPLKGDYGSLAMKGSRNGTIGGEFLNRFNLVIDYYHEHIYLKKNRHYSRAFEHDMSGMNLVAKAPDYSSYRVSSVRYGSPAYEAGIRTGDEIVSINGFTYQTFKLSGAYALLRSKPGRKITIRVLEENKPVKKTFRLARFI